jgi:hypothetical protein
MIRTLVASTAGVPRRGGGNLGIQARLKVIA